MKGRVQSAAAAATVLMLGACSGGEDTSGPAGSEPATESATARTSPDSVVPAKPPEIAPYEPGSAEEFANGKRLAGRVAQRALTYARGASARDVAGSLPPSRVAEAELARVLKPVVDPGSWSVGEVLYPQLSGVTSTSLGVMVVVRQTFEASDGRSRKVTRVLDVRLRRSTGPWSLDTIGSVGGAPVRRPARLSQAAKRVLDNPNIALPDSARWDIHGGAIDTALLTALANAAQEHRLSISVLRSGHPPNVWETSRPSAHSAGFAADIYAVDGRPVIDQRGTEGAANALAQKLYTGGAQQLGSPWVFGYGGPRSFTDAVHQDHIHLQQSPV